MTQKARISLTGTTPQSVDGVCKQIKAISERTGVALGGPIPLPTKKSVYTILRSPHVNKKSREQFETRVHKRLIDIIESTPQTVDALMKLDLPAGVDVEIKV